MDLNKIVEEMRSLGETLTPYNWPKDDTQMENFLNVLKVRFVMFQGYDLALHYNRSDYDDYYSETLQIFSEKYPFLPFTVVAHLGKSFLGQEHLYLVEILKDHKKIYCWSLTTDKGGKPMIPPYHNDLETEDCTYEGFSYKYLYPDQLNFH